MGWQLASSNTKHTARECPLQEHWVNLILSIRPYCYIYLALSPSFLLPHTPRHPTSNALFSFTLSLAILNTLRPSGLSRQLSLVIVDASKSPCGSVIRVFLCLRIRVCACADACGENEAGREGEGGRERDRGSQWVSVSGVRALYAVHCYRLAAAALHAHAQSRTHAAQKARVRQVCVLCARALSYSNADNAQLSMCAYRASNIIAAPIYLLLWTPRR